MRRRTTTTTTTVTATAFVLMLMACSVNVVGIAPDSIDVAEDGAPDRSVVEPADGAPPETSTQADANDAGADADVPDVVVESGADADAGASLFGDTCLAGTVYEDDFSTDPARSWQVVSGVWEWNAAQRTYTLKAIPSNDDFDVGVIWIGPRPQWKNYDVEVVETVSLAPDDHGDVGPVLRVSNIPKKTPQPSDDGEMFLAAAQVQTGNNLILARFTGGAFTFLAGRNTGFDTTKRLTVHATITGASMKAWLNDQSLPNESISATDQMHSAGSIGIRAYKSAVVLERVKVTCR